MNKKLKELKVRKLSDFEELRVDLESIKDVKFGKVFGSKPITTMKMLDKLWRYLVKNDLIRDDL